MLVQTSGGKYEPNIVLYAKINSKGHPALTRSIIIIFIMVKYPGLSKYGIQPSERVGRPLRYGQVYEKWQAHCK